MTTVEQDSPEVKVEETEQEDPRFANLAPFLNALEKNIGLYKTADAEVAAASGDHEAAINAWMENSDDETAVAIREAIVKAQSKLRTLAEENVQVEVKTPEEIARMKTKVEELATKVKKGSRALRALAEPFDLDVTPLLKKLGDPFLPKSPTGDGSSLPRPSVYVEVIRLDDEGEEGEKWNYENLSGAAKLLENTGLDVEALGRLYAEAAGVAYEEIAKHKSYTEFDWQNPAIPNAGTYRVKVTPKESARGRKPANKS